MIIDDNSHLSTETLLSYSNINTITIITQCREQCIYHSVDMELCFFCVYSHRGVYYIIRRVVLFRRSKNEDIHYYCYYYLPHHNIISLHLILRSINTLLRCISYPCYYTERYHSTWNIIYSHIAIMLLIFKLIHTQNNKIVFT